MEFFLPSLLAILLALLITFLISPNLGPLAVATVALVALGFALNSHLQMFKEEYALSSWATSAKGVAPYLMVGAILVFIIGYLLSLFSSGKAPNLPAPPSTMPPANTATNFITRGINNGLANAGLVPVARNVSANTPGESAVSLNRQNGNLTNSEIRRMAESQLASSKGP
jgi:hypothetical protein